MSLNVACGVAIGLSVFLIALAVGIGVFLHRAEVKNTGLEGRRRVLSPFQVFILCFFFAAVAVFYPIYYIDYLAAETGFLRVLKAFLLAVQNVLRLVTLNGEFDIVRDFLASAEIDGTFAGIYSIYVAVIFVTAPLITAGYVLSFFRSVTSMLRYSLRPCNELYALSELNERSLALAKNILSEKDEKEVTDKAGKTKKKKRRRVVIFTDVFDDGERTHELIFTARQMGAICVKRDITDIGLKYARRNCIRKVYLIGDNQDENVEQALKLISRHVKDSLPREDGKGGRSRMPKFNENNLQFYVFSVTAESGVLLDSAPKGNIKVRHINDNRNLALVEMCENSIFSTAIEDGDVKRIKVAIVGTGGYGTELLKVICCLGQMPGYTVEVHVFDRENAEEQIGGRVPELLNYWAHQKPGDAEFKLAFHSGVEAGSKHFLSEIASLGRLSGIYVTLGDDERNIATSLAVRTILNRNAWGAQTPIYAVVYDDTKASLAEKDGLKSSDGQSFGIKVIGSLHKCYSTEYIEQTKLEDSARELHLRWADNDDEKQKARATFANFEYYRRSSMMEAVYRELREKLGYIKKEKETTPEDKAYNDMLRNYEHRRWNTFMRGEGFICGTKEGKDFVAKTHHLVVPFGDLPEGEQKKDDF